MTAKSELSFFDHLDELRSRLTKCLIVFFIGFACAYFFSEPILSWLKAPLFDQLPAEKQKLYYISLFENFLVHLKVAAYTSIALLSPVYIWIVWGFVAPGLYETERKKTIPFITLGLVFFLIGALFAYYVLFPTGVRYFLQYGSTDEVAFLTLENYINVVVRVLFGFGLAFETPVILVFLAKIGLIQADSLARRRRIAIVVITAISALVAPPDAISMLMLMAPLYVLFEGALLVIRLSENARKT